MSGLRTLPIRIAPLPGESLISWMEAYARSCHVNLREQFIAVGLRSYSQAVDRTLYLHDEEAERVAAVTGIPVARIHATTLGPYLGHVIQPAEGRRSVNRAAQWSRGRGSRYCPTCLTERDGRWLVR